MGPIGCRWKILIVLYYVMKHLSIFTRHFRRGFSVFSGFFFLRGQRPDVSAFLSLFFRFSSAFLPLLFRFFPVLPLFLCLSSVFPAFFPVSFPFFSRHDLFPAFLYEFHVFLLTNRLFGSTIGMYEKYPHGVYSPPRPPLLPAKKRWLRKKQCRHRKTASVHKNLSLRRKKLPFIREATPSARHSPQKAPHGRHKPSASAAQ